MATKPKPKFVFPKKGAKGKGLASSIAGYRKSGKLKK